MNEADLRDAIASGNPGRARPGLASLVNATQAEAEPLLPGCPTHLSRENHVTSKSGV
jgi:hypothetical protein